MLHSSEVRTDTRKFRTAKLREQRVAAVGRILRQQRFVKDVLIILQAQKRLESYSQGIHTPMGNSGKIDRALNRLTRSRRKRRSRG